MGPNCLKQRYIQILQLSCFCVQCLICVTVLSSKRKASKSGLYPDELGRGCASLIINNVGDKWSAFLENGYFLLGDLICI